LNVVGLTGFHNRSEKYRVTGLIHRRMHFSIKGLDKSGTLEYKTKDKNLKLAVFQDKLI